MPVELKVPEVGESITEVFVNRWLKKEGDFAEKDETVAELETDKATFELPAPVAGTISKISKPKGETASVGEVIGQMEEGASNGKAVTSKDDKKQDDDGKGEREEKKDSDGRSAKKADSDEVKKKEQRNASPDRSKRSDGDQRVMPSARRAMHEHGVSPEQVRGSGPGGRVLKEDVETAAGREDSGGQRKTGAREEEAVPLSPMRKTIAKRLVEAQQTAALLTTFNEADMSAVIALRKQYQDKFTADHEVKLGFMSFFVKACVDALSRVPAINAEVREDNIIYRNYFDIGVAVSTKKGLVVPVIRNAESLSFAEIEKTVLDFGQRGKENKIALDELEGGTFTITNGGIFGSLLSTPIVNPPQSGVLGMHAIQERVIVVNGEMVIRPMMYLALTYDHRIVDGREAVTFLKRVKECIEDPNRMLMEV